MTQEQYNKAEDVLKQIKKLQVLSNRLQLDYNKYKDTDEHLLETLSKFNEVISVLIEIDENKFKAL